MRKADTVQNVAASAALALLAILPVGCVAEDSKAQAQSVAEGYLQAVKANDLDRAITFFASHYPEIRSPQGLKTDIQIITGRLGELRDYRLTAARWRRDFIPPETGTLVTLEYDVRYTKHQAHEIFMILKPFGRGEYKIVGHRIASEGF